MKSNKKNSKLDLADSEDPLKNLKRFRHLHWYHWTIVIGSLALTLLAWNLSKSQIESRLQIRFDTQARETVQAIIIRMQKYEDALWGGVAAIHSQSHGIDYDEWKRFADTLHIEEKYPGINGIGVIFNFPREKTREFLEEQRTTRPDFKIFPEHKEEELWPITFIEPIETNSAAVGLDMAHENNRYTAAKQSRDTGTAQITGPIILVQDAEKTPGFLFYAPFYNSISYKTAEERKENFIGLVYAPFIFKKLMLGTLANRNRDLGVSIYDGETVLYTEDKPPNNKYYSEKTLKVYGRNWVFRIWDKPAFTKNVIGKEKPWIILFGGLLIDTFLFVIFLELTSSNRKALNYANKMSSEYKKQNEELIDLQAKMENAYKFQDLIINTIPDFVFVKDKDHKIVLANKFFINSYPPEKRDKIIGYTTWEDYKPEEVEKFTADDNEAFEKGEKEVQESVLFPDGRRRVVYTKKVAFENDGKQFLLGVSRDITEIKKAEEDILRSNTELERFAYIASHDLQEPVRMITNFSRLLDEEYAQTLDEDGQQYIKFITDASIRMKDLIADLLEYSRLGSEAAPDEEFDAGVKIGIVLENLGEIIKGTGAKIHISDMPEIYGSPVRFIRVMQNLIGNAIKYQNPDSTPELFVNAEEKSGEWLFSIKDNGIGIPQENHEDVFKIFRRLHTEATHPGDGVGLTYAKKAINKAGGEIALAKNEQGGTDVILTLPASQKD